MGYAIWITICGVVGFLIGLQWYETQLLLSTLIGLGFGIVTSVMVATGSSGFGGIDFGDFDFD
jgi:multidrug transporter EmrE-like cation transporter